MIFGIFGSLNSGLTLPNNQFELFKVMNKTGKG
jgi:hypothetical protein